MILLAIIASAHGIQGAVKVKTFTQIPTNIFDYGPLRNEKGQTFSLKLVREVSANSLIMKIDGITDRNQAEALRGTKLFVDRQSLPDLPEEEFYYNDLIGLTVKDLEGDLIGIIDALGNYGAGDFLEISDAEHHVYTIPFTREAVPIVRLPEKGKDGEIRVDRQFLLNSTAPQNEEIKAEEFSEKKE
jgi:16S rRNA processing protein RimM